MSGPEPDDSGVPGSHIWGWMSHPELEWLSETAARMDSVCEIGCLHGRSAFAILTACAGPVWCIDPWNDEYDRSYPSFMGSCGHFPNLHPLRAMSPDAASLVPDVDMTFIDGAHAYGSVMADIAAWLPKTRKIICGHDYTNVLGYPGVKEAVDEVFGERASCAEETSIWWVDLTLDRSVEPGARTGVYSYTDEYGRDLSQNIRWPAGSVS